MIAASAMATSATPPPIPAFAPAESPEEVGGKGVEIAEVGGERDDVIEDVVDAVELTWSVAWYHIGIPFPNMVQSPAPVTVRNAVFTVLGVSQIPLTFVESALYVIACCPIANEDTHWCP